MISMMCCVAQTMRPLRASSRWARLESSRRAIALAEKHSAVFAAIGVHPNSIEDAEDDVITPLRELAKNPRVVAIGETGLDYHRLPSEKVAKEEQVQVMSALRTETDEEIE